MSKSDWSLHKTLCKAFTKVPPRPAKPSKLGILLSADSPDPRFVWVPCPKITDEPFYEGADVNSFDKPIVDSFLGPDTSIEQSHIDRNERRGYRLGRQLVLYLRDNALNDLSKPNQAALALTEWNMPHSWRGNILVMSYGLTAADDEDFNPYLDFEDVNAADLRTVVDYLSLYGRSRNSPHNCNGVLIRCAGEISLNIKAGGKWERYSDIKVTKDDPIWRESPVVASKIMGLPLLVRKYPPNPKWDQCEITRFDNQPATFLNFEVDPKNPDWEFAPPKWQDYVGNVLLVRQDGEDLSREQGWAIAEYMQFRVSDIFEDAMNSGDTKLRRSAILKMLNWKKFESFLENFSEEMTASDYKSWANVKSPFGTREIDDSPY